MPAASESAGSTGVRRRPRWRRLVLVVAGLLAAAALLVAVALPPLAARWIEAEIARAIAGDRGAVEVAAAVTLRWAGPIEARVAVEPPRGREGPRLAAGVLVDRGIASLLLRPRGLVILEFEVDGAIEGEAAWSEVDRWFGIEPPSPPPARPPPAPALAATDRLSAPAAEAFRVPSGWSLVARGRVDLRLLDETRGVDLAVRTRDLELSGAAGEPIGVLLDAAVGRAGEWPDLTGAIRIEAAATGAIAADGAATPLAAEGVGVVEARGIAIEWAQRQVEIADAALSLRGDRAALSIAGRGRAAIDGEPLEFAADLRWLEVLAADGTPRFAPAAFDGTVALSGVPVAALGPLLPAPVATLLGDLGATLAATLSVPADPQARVEASLLMDRTTLVVSGRLDRTEGAIEAGEVLLSAEISRDALRRVGALLDPPLVLEAVPPAAAASGVAVSLRGEGLRIPATRVVSAERVIATIDGVDRLAVPGDPAAAWRVEIEPPGRVAATLEQVRWDPGAPLAQIAGHASAEVDGVLRLLVSDGDGAPPRALAVDRPSVALSAEPLGTSLSLRMVAEVEGAALRVEQRFEHLWSSARADRGEAGWVGVAQLRPHGSASLLGVVPSRFAAWMPPAVGAGVLAVGDEPISLQLNTRAEGDRLEGGVRFARRQTRLDAQVSIDAQRVVLGPIEGTIRVEPQLAEALGDLWPEGLALSAPADLALRADPLVWPPLPWADGLPTLPAGRAAITIDAVRFDRVPGLPYEALAEGAPPLRIEALSASAEWTSGLERIENAAALRAGWGDALLGEVAWSAERRAAAPGGDPRLDAALTLRRGDVAAIERLLGGGDWGRRIVGERVEVEATLRGEGDLLRGEAQLRGPQAAVRIEGGAAMEGEARRVELAVPAWSVELPAVALRALLDQSPAADAIEPRSPLRARGSLGRVVWRAGEPIEWADARVEVDPLKIAAASASGPVEIDLPRLLATLDAAEAGELRLRIDSEGPAATPRLAASAQWRPARVDRAWRLDGEATLERWPTGIVGVFLDDGGLVEAALGAQASLAGVVQGLGPAQGELRARLESTQGRIDLPRLAIAAEGAVIPQDAPLVASLDLSPALRSRLLSNLNPIFADLERTDGPLRLSMHATRLPLDGDRSRLDADLRLETGAVRIRPGLALSLPLMLAGDASAAGFDGLIEPLVGRVREGLLTYEGFTARFVRSGDQWRQTLVFSGRIDLAATPPFAQAITTTYPGSNLARFSSDLRRLPPGILEALTVPVTFSGPLDGSEPLKYRLDLDVAEILRRGAEAALPDLLDRFLRPRR